MDLTARATALVHALGLCAPKVVPQVTPLTGGVASDIARVDWPGGTVCVKFALERLRVAQDWRAPVSRNAAEYAWLQVAGRVLPGCAPELHGRDDALGGFAMGFVADGVLWKAALLDGRSDGAEAAAVADALGRLHAAGAAPGFDRAPFGNMALFRALRIEPYITFTATRHPEVAGALTALAERLAQASQTLIHGDISPKNILIRADGPVFLDAECATMGDPAFDVAFCINHLILKGFHRPAGQAALWGSAGAFWRSYAARIVWESAPLLESRLAALIPALMLARIDGKSPVEYLDAATGAQVRAAAIALLRAPPATVAALLTRLKDHA